MRLTKGWGLGELEQPHPVSACPSPQAPGLPHSYPRGRGEETCVLPGGGALRGWELLGLAGPSGPTTHSGVLKERNEQTYLYTSGHMYTQGKIHTENAYTQENSFIKIAPIAREGIIHPIGEWV